MPSQSSIWAKLVCEAGGFRNRSIHFRFTDGAEAVLPVFSGSPLLGPLTISRSPPAAWGFGGPISSRPLGPGHIRLILDHCAALPGAGIQIRPNPRAADVWTQAAQGSGWDRLHRTAHILDLSGGFDTVWNERFAPRSRSAARKAERAGITIDSGSHDDLAVEFDGLFRLSIARWARKQNESARLAAFRAHLRDPRRKFLHMARQSGGIVRISIARRAGRPIAGIVVLYGRNAHYTRGAMDEQEVGNSGANHLLHRIAIAEACDRSCRFYHMGETGASTSLANFKEGFGAAPVPYAEYRHERIPVMSTNQHLRSIVKKAIGFRDA
ncbi:GNAT family N-acetyltransferase [Tabrizicola sp. M-4]|uniref:GNAT family N-acetyltransferase n=1 Tax=Tabrizicola sp. M-4 TaxID=3055847 RepID=UPI003DA8FFAB